MKKIVAFYLLIFLNIAICFGQAYHPMLGDSSTWYVFNSNLAQYTEVFKANSDTVKNGLHYKIFASTSFSSDGYFIREDSINRKVYALPFLNSGYQVSDSSELILYDFSLSENDNISLFEPQIHDSLRMFYVDSIRPINTLVGIRKAFYMKRKVNGTSYFKYSVWVEGIGAIGCPLDRGELDSYMGRELTCFFRNDIKVYQSQRAIDNNGCDIATGIKYPIKNELITIFPNPASTKIDVDIPYPIDYVLTVFDVLGKQLIRQSNSKTIDLNGLNDGIYVLKIKIDNTVIVKKFLKN